MSNPTSSDDDWNDLARELGVNKSAQPPEPHPAADTVERQAEAVEPHHGDSRAEDEGGAEGESADEEFEDAEEGAPEANRPRKARRAINPAPGASAGGAGVGRRKGSGAAPGGAAPAEGGEEETGAEPGAESEEPAPEPVAEGDEFDANGAEDADAEEAEPVPLAAEEDTASEVLRDLIANWNVPSWDDIVGGLYRPN